MSQDDSGPRKESFLNVPAFNEVFEALTPFYTLSVIALRWLVFQFWNRLSDNVSQEVDQSRSGLHLCAVSGKRKSMLRHLEQSDTKRPHVRCDCVRLPSDSLWCHVVRRADEGIGIALGAELARDTKVAKTDETIPGKENVRRLDICNEPSQYGMARPKRPKSSGPIPL